MGIKWIARFSMPNGEKLNFKVEDGQAKLTPLWQDLYTWDSHDAALEYLRKYFELNPQLKFEHIEVIACHAQQLRTNVLNLPKRQ
jgi:hypothetical protein